ncbi:unnamed protein product [Lota lota]
MVTHHRVSAYRAAETPPLIPIPSTPPLHPTPLHPSPSWDIAVVHELTVNDKGNDDEEDADVMEMTTERRREQRFPLYRDRTALSGCRT